MGNAMRQNATRPKSLDEIIGQDEVKETCRILIGSARIRNTAMPHMLFSGPSGTGKSTFGEALASEIDTNFYMTNAASIKDFDSLALFLNELDKGDILFIDEIHRLKIKIWEMLYHAVEDFRYPKQMGNLSSMVDLKPFTLIGATTDLGAMPIPARGRFKQIFEFRPYNRLEMRKIVKRVFAVHKMKQVPDAMADFIAGTCRQNPRAAVSRAEFVRDWCLVHKKFSISLDELEKIISKQGFDKHGLTDMDRRYIKILTEHSEISLVRIAQKLGINEFNVKNDVEPWLIRIGLVDVTRGGRMITPLYHKMYPTS